MFGGIGVDLGEDGNARRWQRHYTGVRVLVQEMNQSNVHERHTQGNESEVVQYLYHSCQERSLERKMLSEEL